MSSFHGYKSLKSAHVLTPLGVALLTGASMMIGANIAQAANHEQKPHAMTGPSHAMTGPNRAMTGSERAKSDHATAESGTGKNKTDHYERQQPKTESQARDVLNKSMDTVSVLMKKTELEDQDFEAIHEVTYSMESSIKFLKSNSKSKKINKRTVALKEIEDSVEQLHESSEDRKNDQVRVAWAQTQKAFVALYAPQ